MSDLTQRGTPRIRARYGAPVSEKIRFHSRVNENDCWIWQATRTPAGYGHIRLNGKVQPAHRVSYEAFVGPIPDGLHLDHLCRTPACVNPGHLEAVPPRVNTLRGIGPTAQNAVKTHCVNGHEFTTENTYLRSDRFGRNCRTCAIAGALRRTA